MGRDYDEVAFERLPAATNIDAAGSVVDGRGKADLQSADRRTSSASPRAKPAPDGAGEGTPLS